MSSRRLFAVALVGIVVGALRFEKGKLPLIDAFWSVTAYDADGYFMPNAQKRRALDDRDKLDFTSNGYSAHVLK